MVELVVCESVVAIVTHVRSVDPKTPINLSGHSPRPLALCGAQVAWDTRLPLAAATCKKCILAAGILDAFKIA